MSEKVYWNWFAMPTQGGEYLWVVVEECFNYYDDGLDVLGCKVISEPMSMLEAEGEAMRRNSKAIAKGEHISNVRRRRQ